MNRFYCYYYYDYCYYVEEKKNYNKHDCVLFL